jgi:hypothetical protein
MAYLHGAGNLNNNYVRIRDFPGLDREIPNNVLGTLPMEQIGKTV